MIYAIALLTACVSADDSIVPSSAQNHKLSQELLRNWNGYREKHCAEPVTWSSTLENIAKKIVECKSESCKQVSSNQAWLSQSIRATVKEEQLTDDEGLTTTQRKFEKPNMGEEELKESYNIIVNAYEAGEEVNNKDFTLKEMVDKIKEFGANSPKSLVALLIWRYTREVGCSVVEEPEAMETYNRTQGILKPEEKAPKIATIVCVSQSLYSGAGQLVPGKEPYFKYLNGGIYPAQSNPEESCKEFIEKYPQEKPLPYEKISDAFQSTLTLMRRKTCAPEIHQDADLVKPLDQFLSCYTTLTKDESFNKCEDAFKAAFPAEGENAVSVSIFGKRDHCLASGDSHGGCGLAFDTPVVQAATAIFTLGNKFDSFTGKKSKDLTHSEFVEEFKKLSPEQQEQLNAWAMINWNPGQGVKVSYACVDATRKFDPVQYGKSALQHTQTSWKLCAVQTTDPENVPAQEGLGADKFTPWYQSLYTGGQCHHYKKNDNDIKVEA